MNCIKNGLLLAAGSLAGLILAAILEEDAGSDGKTPSYDGGRPSLDPIVEVVKSDAEAAMAACHTDEEREAVYAKVSETIGGLQKLMAEKGGEIVDALREKAAREAAEDSVSAEEIKSEAETHIENLRETASAVATALDEVLSSLKPEANGAMGA